MGKVYIAQLMMVYTDIKRILNRKKKNLRPTDAVKKLFIETGNKQLFIYIINTIRHVAAVAIQSPNRFTENPNVTFLRIPILYSVI